MKTHEHCGRPLAVLTALLMAVLATLAAGAATAQVSARKPVKWVVTCPVPRAAAKPASAENAESAPTPALAVPDPVEGLVDALGPAPVAPAPAGPAAAPEVRVAAATPPAPVFRVATVPRWEVLTSDMTLSKTLARWAQDAGYRLQWDAPRNFLIGAPTGFGGDFETAVSALLSTPGIRLSEFPLEACVYSNSPPLLRITRYGEQARECAVASPNATRTANLP